MTSAEWDRFVRASAKLHREEDAGWEGYERFKSVLRRHRELTPTEYDAMIRLYTELAGL